MEKREWRVPAANGIGRIYSVLYQEPELEKKAIVLIIHGMQSHSGRYRWLAEHLAKKGYVVAAQDLQGHGRSAEIPGYFGESNGWEYMLRDIHHEIIQLKKWFPGLPVLLLGHSMGSFLSRSFAAKYPGEISALLLSGTAGSSPFYRPIRAAIATDIFIHGGQASAISYSYRMARYFNRNIPDPVNLGAWCTTVREICIEHSEDPLSVGFTLGAYYDMLGGLISISGPEWAERVENIPIYIFAGGADPVGEYGRGPAEVYAWLRGTGHKRTSLRIYPAKRHEVLNEDIRCQVVEDMENWIEQALKPEEV